MKNWTIKKRTVTGFAIVLLLFAIVAVTSTLLLNKVKTHQQSLTEDALPGLEGSESIVATASELQLNVLRHIFAKTPEEKKPFDETIASLIQTNHQELTNYESSIFRPDDREQFAKVEATREEYINGLEPVLKLSREGKSDEAMELNKRSLRPAYYAFQKECQALFDENKRCGDNAAAESQKALTLTSRLVLSLSIVAILLGIALAALISIGMNRILNRVARALGDGSALIVSAASQVSASSQSLAEGASEQAASLEETSSSLEEMSSMTKRNAENAQKANDLAKQARTAADKGTSDMQTMNAAMEAIKVSSDDIAKIIKTIDEIAFQTNILALNAAVEAARAGEAGMGFAVVADEVRNLAQRSAQAAKETAAKIEGAINNTAQGVQISTKVTEALNEIVTKARQVDELVAEVASASREQTQGISQVNTAVSQMDKVTQSNAANAEESAAAAEELNAQAISMKESVAELLQLVGSAANRSERTEPAMPKPEKKPFLKTPAAHNGHGHTAKVLSSERESAPSLVASRRDEIPLDGDFKDF